MLGGRLVCCIYEFMADFKWKNLVWNVPPSLWILWFCPFCGFLSPFLGNFWRSNWSEQLDGFEVVLRAFGHEYMIWLTLAPNSPWLASKNPSFSSLKSLFSWFIWVGHLFIDSCAQSWCYDLKGTYLVLPSIDFSWELYFLEIEFYWKPQIEREF